MTDKEKIRLLKDMGDSSFDWVEADGNVPDGYWKGIVYMMMSVILFEAEEKETEE